MFIILNSTDGHKVRVNASKMLGYLDLDDSFGKHTIVILEEQEIPVVENSNQIDQALRELFITVKEVASGTTKPNSEQ